MSNSLLVLDDIDQIAAGQGPSGYSSIMLSTLRALIRTPPPSSAVAKAGGQSKGSTTKTLHIIATTSRSDAACSILNEIFEETIGKSKWFCSLLLYLAFKHLIISLLYFQLFPCSQMPIQYKNFLMIALEIKLQIHHPYQRQ